MVLQCGRFYLWSEKTIHGKDLQFQPVPLQFVSQALILRTVGGRELVLCWQVLCLWAWGTLHNGGEGGWGGRGRGGRRGGGVGTSQPPNPEPQALNPNPKPENLNPMTLNNVQAGCYEDLGISAGSELSTGGV